MCIHISHLSAGSCSWYWPYPPPRSVPGVPRTSIRRFCPPCPSLLNGSSPLAKLYYQKRRDFGVGCREPAGTRSFFQVRIFSRETDTKTTQMWTTQTSSRDCRSRTGAAESEEDRWTRHWLRGKMIGRCHGNGNVRRTLGRGVFQIAGS